jgi:hypothetical protein
MGFVMELTLPEIIGLDDDADEKREGLLGDGGRRGGLEHNRLDRRCCMRRVDHPRAQLSTVGAPDTCVGSDLSCATPTRARASDHQS